MCPHPLFKDPYFCMAGPLSSGCENPVDPRRGTNQASFLGSAMKNAQDQIKAVKPPPAPRHAFLSLFLLVAGTFQYHLGGRAAGTSSPKQGHEGDFAMKPLYLTEMVPDVTHICLLTHQELLANFQSQPSGQRLGFRPQYSNTTIKLFLLQILAQWKKRTLLPVHTCISFETLRSGLYSKIGIYTYAKSNRKKYYSKATFIFATAFSSFPNKRSIEL